MKRPVPLGNGGSLLNDILFRIITSLYRTRLDQLFGVLKPFWRLGEIKRVTILQTILFPVKLLLPCKKHVKTHHRCC